MGVAVVAVPKALRLRCECLENELHPRGGIGAEDDVELLGVGIKEAEDTETDVVDALGGLLGGGGWRVRVAVDV